MQVLLMYTEYLVLFFFTESFPLVINNGSDVTLKFDSGGKQRRAGGFQILYSIFREAENGECAADEFMCDWDRRVTRMCKVVTFPMRG